MAFWKRLLDGIAPPLYDQAQHEATLAVQLQTPDRIICGTLLESFAKEIEDWEFKELDHGDAWELRYRKPWFDAMANTNRQLLNRRRGIRLNWCRKWVNEVRANVECFVDFTRIDDDLASEAIKGYFVAKAAHDELKRVEAETKAAEAAHAARWLVAERLTGMRKNDQGALEEVKPQRRRRVKPIVDKPPLTDQQKEEALDEVLDALDVMDQPVVGKRYTKADAYRTKRPMTQAEYEREEGIVGEYYPS